MAYLFDTNALSETLRKRPNPRFTSWLRTLPKDRQFTSSVVVSELFVAAYREKPGSTRWMKWLRETILPTLQVIHFDVDCADSAGRLQAALMDRGEPIETADAMIAATALHHRLPLVTADVRHYERIAGLELVSFEPGEQGAFQAPS